MFLVTFASLVTFVSLGALVAFGTLASFTPFPFIGNVSIGQSRSTLAFPRILASSGRRGAPVRCACAPMGGRSGSPLNMVRGGPKSQKVGGSG